MKGYISTKDITGEKRDSAAESLAFNVLIEAEGVYYHNGETIRKISNELMDCAYWSAEQLQTIFPRSKYTFVETAVQFRALYEIGVINYDGLCANIDIVRDAAKYNAPELLLLLECFLIPNAHEIASMVSLNSLGLVVDFINKSNGMWMGRVFTNDEVWDYFSRGFEKILLGE